MSLFLAQSSLFIRPAENYRLKKHFLFRFYWPAWSCKQSWSNRFPHHDQHFRRTPSSLRFSHVWRNSSQHPFRHDTLRKTERRSTRTPCHKPLVHTDSLSIPYFAKLSDFGNWRNVLAKLYRKNCRDNIQLVEGLVNDLKNTILVIYCQIKLKCVLEILKAGIAVYLTVSKAK